MAKSGIWFTAAVVALAHARLTRGWTPADLDYVFEKTSYGQMFHLTRQWIIWHVIEHDLHHGGEVSLTLGMHGLAAPDL